MSRLCFHNGGGGANLRWARGFTLAELVGAMVVLTVAIPPVLQAVGNAQVRRVAPVLVEHAHWLAVEKLEDVIADRHSTTRGYSYLVTANYPAETSIAGYTSFSRNVAFSETGADLSTAGTGYMRVTVTVTWSDARGASRSLALATILTDYRP
jgi:hypothetical protein